MNNNGQVDYTSLGTNEIRADINARLLIDEQLQNFPDSSLAKMLLNHISSIVDVANFNAEMVAQESLLSSAKNQSSMVGKANNLAYSIRRRTPATATIQINVKIPNVTISNGDYLHIPRFTKVRVRDTFVITTEPLTRNLVPSDSGKELSFSEYYTSDAQLGNLLMTSAEVAASTAKLTKRPIGVIQGEIKSFTFHALSAENRGTLKYQRYKIPDVGFSDLFGSHDLYADEATGYYDLGRSITQVSVAKTEAELFTDDTLYKIDRVSFVGTGSVYKGSYKSLYSNEDLGVIGKDNLPKICVIRSDESGGVELAFGDDTVVQTPSDTLGNIIGIRYLRTLGDKGNNFSIRGRTESASTETFIYAKDGSQYSPSVSVKFTSHLVGGEEVESVESIRRGVPSYYSTKDRLVTIADYESYMSSLTSPFQVKRAIAFGEQEYVAMTDGKYRFANPFRNVVAFSILGRLYDTDRNDAIPLPVKYKNEIQGGGIDFASTLNASLLDGDDYDEWSMVAYYSILSKRELLSYRNRYELSRFLDYDISDSQLVPTSVGLENSVVVDRDYDLSHPVRKFYSILNNRSMLNVNHVYISPIVQKFSLTGEVFISDFADATSVKSEVNNAIYSFLEDNTDFKSPIFRSQLEEIVNAHKDVAYSNLELVATSDWSTAYNGDTFSAIEAELDCRRFIDNASFAPINIVSPYDSCINVDSNGFWYAALFHEFADAQAGVLLSNGFNNTITVIVRRDSVSGEIAEGVSETDLGKIKLQMLGSLVKLTLDKVSFPALTENPEVLGAITGITPVSVLVGSSVNIAFPNAKTTAYTPTYVNANVPKATPWTEGETLQSTDYYIMEVSFGDAELLSLSGETTGSYYFAGGISQSVKIISSSWLDITQTPYSGSVCSYFLGFCPEKYISDSIQRALKSIYAELHGVFVCGVCGSVEQISGTTTTASTHVCNNCRCSYGSSVSSDTISGTLQSRNSQPETLILQDAASLSTFTPSVYGSVYDPEDVLKGKTYEQRSYDVAEYFNIVVPKEVLSCWEGELSLEKKIHHRIRVTERWFYEVLVKRIVNELRFYAYQNSVNSVNTVSKFKEDLLVKVTALFAAKYDDVMLVKDRTINQSMYTEEEIAASQASLANDLVDVVYGDFGSVDNITDATAYDMPNNVEKFLNSNAFINIILKLKQGFSQGIRSGMMDRFGNIVNYSLPNEIAQVTSSLSFRKRV